MYAVKTPDSHGSHCRHGALHVSGTHVAPRRLDEQQAGGFHLSRVANFCLTTSTGNINEHLFDNHEIVVESSSSIRLHH